MVKPGDIVVLPYCDVDENQEIIGHPVRVIRVQEHSPFWADVVCDDTVSFYTVRGRDLRLATKEQAYRFNRRATAISEMLDSCKSVLAADTRNKLLTAIKAALADADWVTHQFKRS